MRATQVIRRMVSRLVPGCGRIKPAFIVGCLLVSGGIGGSAAERPDIVLIMSDDK